MVKISSDSTADLEYLFIERNVPVMPLCVILDGKEHLDGVDIDAQMIFDRYEQNHILPKTSARSIEDYEAFFAEHTKDGSAIVHFIISGEMSVSYTNALTASRKFKDVFVVDSRSLSTGQGLLVLKACDFRDAGMEAQQIYDKITELVPYVQASFVVDTMEYLHKGGRCSGVAKFFASAFSIKPMIMLKDGKMVVGQKYVGKLGKCIEKYVAAILKEFDTPDTTRIFITHTYADDEIVESVKAQIRELRPEFKEILETHAGCTVTAHCGKGTLGILYINKPE
ncbi:MAG: DegV family protein [Clostridiales bacterium]|nr:DegV family protein [Clostridiales bacterium]